MAWEILSRRKLLDKWPYLRVYQEKVKTEQGKVVDDYYQLEALSFSVIFPVMEDGQIALIRHYRHAVKREVYDLPGGAIDEGETPLACAQRELREETGLTAPDWKFLGAYKLSQVRGIADAHLYIATSASQTHQPTQNDLSETTVHFFSPSEVLSMWSTGEWPIITTGALVGLGLAEIGVF